MKRYLRQVYGLSEARCIAYDPNEKQKVAEKAISRSDSKVRFDTTVTTSSGLDGLIQQYAAFRILMREENTLAVTANKESDLEEEEDDEKIEEEDEEVPTGSRKRKSS